jgi:hypothetical protein
MWYDSGGMDDTRVTIETLLQRIAVLEKTVETLQNENKLLREHLEQQQRTSARQAAPFRRRENKKVPEGEKKRPGRKPGHPGTNRPVPEHIDQEIEQPWTVAPNAVVPSAIAGPSNNSSKRFLPCVLVSFV